MDRSIGGALIALATIWTTAAPAHEVTLGSIKVEHPFLRATLPDATTGSASMIIRNTGTSTDRIIGIETEAARSVEFYRSVIESGVTTMVPIEGGIEIPAGLELRLGFDGTHAMLIGLTAPIGLGEYIPGTLIFENAGRLKMGFEVEPMVSESAPPDHQHSN